MIIGEQSEKLCSWLGHTLLLSVPGFECINTSEAPWMHVCRFKEEDTDNKVPCACGAPNCRGTLN